MATSNHSPQHQDLRLIAGRVIPLIYHDFALVARPYHYSLTVATFREHLQTITRSSKNSSNFRVAVTFDDGDRSQLEHAVPLLAEFGISAFFFITSGWTDVRKSSMSSADLREIAVRGHTMGAHGATHKLLT